MRVIAGMAGGIRLQAPEGRGVRPTEDRVKESIFSTLGDLRGRRVLDLFSGSGALGLEALSRGASHVVFVEQNRRHMDYVRKNHAAVVKAMGESAGSCAFFCADARHASTLLASEAPFDILLADPPYETPAGGYGACEILQDAALLSILNPRCLLALEHAAATILVWEPASCWTLLKQKNYGIRAVSFATPKQRDAND